MTERDFTHIILCMAVCAWDHFGAKDAAHVEAKLKRLD